MKPGDMVCSQEWKNEVERSRIKRKVFPSGVQLQSANSILVQCACCSRLENLLAVKLSDPQDP